MAWLLFSLKIEIFSFRLIVDPAFTLPCLKGLSQFIRARISNTGKLFQEAEDLKDLNQGSESDARIALFQFPQPYSGHRSPPCQFFLADTTS